MEQNKKFISIFTLFTAFSAIAGVFVPQFSENTRSLSNVNAEECAHSESMMVHYDATGTSRDHYVCCGCHQAWADEERTILLSTDTYLDRSKLDGEAYYNISHRGTDYDWVWDDAAKIATVENLGSILYRDFTNTVEAFIQTIDTDITVKEGLIHEVEVTNNTDSTLAVTSTSRTWNSTNGTYTIELEPGEKGLVKISSHCWNNNEIPTDKKGFAIKLINVNGGAFSGTVVFDRPHTYKQQDLFDRTNR